MSAGTRVGWWLAAVLGGIQILGVGATAAAEEGLRSGMKELGFAGGLSISHTIKESRVPLEDVTGYQLMPRLGYVVTDEHGPGWLRGNFELLAEPTLIYLDAKTSSATVGGMSALGRWVFASGSVVRPYLEGGGGLVFGQTELNQTMCDVNFIIQGGPGVMLFLSERAALTFGYRFQHISNGGTCTPNLGLNSSVFIVGVSYFFP